MNWLPTLLKQLALSRSLIIVAAFVTASIMYVGPRVAPDFIEPVPREWAFLLTAILTFTGFLVMIWVAASIWRYAKKSTKALYHFISTRRLSRAEEEFLLGLAMNPNGYLDISKLDYSQLGWSRLQLEGLIDGLKTKGLISVNKFSITPIISLSASGRKRAITLDREYRAASDEV